MKTTIVGVMGPGEAATDEDCRIAGELGRLIAQEGWGLATGGRSAGVMHAASAGAKSAGGLTIGILPGANRSGASEAVDIQILTDLGEARNNVNVLTSEVVFVCGMNAGTASEAALAVKAGRPVILVSQDDTTLAFFRRLDPEIRVAADPRQAVGIGRSILGPHDIR